MIVSPLLSLMRNQIAAAERIGIRACSITSTNTSEWPALQRMIRRDEADVLLISPERLANDDFVQDVLPELYSIRADKGARKRLVFADFATLPVAGLMVAYAEQTKGLFLLRT